MRLELEAGRYVATTELSGSVLVEVHYSGGTGSLLTIRPGERCATYCGFSDCEGMGGLVLERLYFELSSSAVLDTGRYFCEWEHGSVEAGP